MLQVNDELDTRDVDVEGQDPDGSDGNSGAPGEGGDQSNEDFLVINDRQRYKTQEEAIRAFGEAGERIAQLSGWEKELKRYGVEDPRVAATLLDELIQHRQDREKREKEAKGAPAEQKKTTATDDEADLSKEDQDALKWLKKHAPRLGFVPKDELQPTIDELKQQIAELKQGNESANEERRNSLIEDGRSNVTKWLADDKFADPDGNKRQIVETLVTAWINSDDARVKKFYAGGIVTSNLLKEGYDLAKKQLGWSAAAGTKQNSSTSYAQSKGNALVRNGRRLPQPGMAGKQTKQDDGVKRDAGGRKDYIGSAHNKAWEIAEKHFHPKEAE
jgi:hypothetical protein